MAVTLPMALGILLWVKALATTPWDPGLLQAPLLVGRRLPIKVNRCANCECPRLVAQEEMGVRLFVQKFGGYLWLLHFCFTCHLNFLCVSQHTAFVFRHHDIQPHSFTRPWEQRGHCRQYFHCNEVAKSNNHEKFQTCCGFQLGGHVG